MIGIGLSIPEAQKTVRNISNRVFGRTFKIAEDHDNEELSSIDLDTLPNERSIRKIAKQVETHMKAEAQEIVDRKFEGGNVFTPASDSTTKKGVGMKLLSISIEMSVYLFQPFLWQGRPRKRLLSRLLWGFICVQLHLERQLRNYIK